MLSLGRVWIQLTQRESRRVGTCEEEFLSIIGERERGLDTSKIEI